MAFIPVPDTLLVEIIYEQAGQTIENTMYFEKTDGWLLADVISFLAALRTTVEEELMPLLHTSIALVRLVATLLDAVDALSFTNTVSPPVAGSDNGDPLPNGNAYVITFLTAGRGRSNRGRNYIAGLNSNVMANANNVSTAFRTGLLSAYDTINALAIATGVDMVVVSRFSGVDGAGKPIPRATGVTSIITGFTTFDTIVDSQRRRLPGRGA
jgi:hypothetical protein